MEKYENPNQLGVGELARIYGYDDWYDFVNDECMDSVVPACCKHGCEVEPDGHCEHNCPSPLVALEII